MIDFLIVIVHDLDVIGVTVAPPEADPPLLVDPNAELAGAITNQRLEPVARQRGQRHDRRRRRPAE